MRRYAFIDVQNTASTAQKMLGFLIDWKKVCDYLKNKKSCSEIFLYTGIDNLYRIEKAPLRGVAFPE